MEIRPYEASMAPDAAAAYNAAVRDVPHCYSVRAEQFDAAVTETQALCGDDVPLHSQQALVALEGGSVAGFIHVGIQPPKQRPDPERGILRMFWYEPGRRAAGQELLESAEAHVRSLGAPAVEAYPQHYTYEFYQLHSSFLSDHLGHVGALLGFNGYRKAAGEVFLDSPDFRAVEPAASEVAAEIAVEREESPHRRPVITVRAVVDGRQVGICCCQRVGDYNDDPAAREWFFVHWLGVDGPLRGRGLGKHLLQRALVENRAAGYRHAAISTAWDNHRAFVFYTNIGFRVADWTYGLRKQLAE